MASNYIGGGAPAVESSEPHTAVSETPAPIEALQPPATSAGSDDPTGGIGKEAGGLSSTSGIGSPVSTESQTVVGSVLEYAFGKKERTAQESDATTAPTTDSVTAAPSSTETTANHSGTYIGAIAAAGGAAVASIIPGMASTSGAEPHAATTSSTATEPVSSSTPADVKSSTAATEDKTVGEKAAEVTESAKATASETAQSAANTASAAGESVKESVSGEKEESHSKPKQVSDHEAAIRENQDAIPTAGGEKLGAAHAGESKEIPDVPKTEDESSKVSSSAGQPDTTTADNTAKNTGSADKKGLPILGGKKDGAEGSSDKPKFMDRLKNKLHIGDKKDKA